MADEHVRRPGELDLTTGNTQVAWSRFKQKFEMYLISIGKDEASSKECEFKDPDDMVRDRLIFGHRSVRVQETFVEKGQRAKITLKDAIDVCKSIELSAQKYGLDEEKGPEGPAPPARSEKVATYNCWKCGRVHEAGNCPAHGQTCRKCDGRNHFVIHCTKTPQDPAKNSAASKSVHTLTTAEEDALLDGSWDKEQPDVHTLAVLSIDNVVITCGESARPWKEYTKIVKVQGEHLVKFKLDPGSEVNIILPMAVFTAFKRNYNVDPTRTLVKGFGEKIYLTEGIVRLRIDAQHGSHTYCGFLLTSHEPRPLLGIEACETLGLIKRVKNPEPKVHTVTVGPSALPETKESFVQLFPDIFDGLGEFKNKVHIAVDPNVIPRACPPRRFNYYIAAKLKTKLEELVSRKIISKVVDEIPTFVSNLVIREKADGDLRLCLDPELLNKAIVRKKYDIPTMDEIACRLKDKRVFTVLDLKEGFWHATLDERSSLLCTFSTPYGLNKFLKMPFGISCAPEVFQFMNDQAFADLDIIKYFDDCLVAGTGHEEHDKLLMQLIERARAENIKFNISKLQYRQSNVKFLGHLWSHNEIKIDPGRVQAITSMKEPRTKKQLEKALESFGYPKVEYIPGKQMNFADLLSRYYPEDSLEAVDPDLAEVVHEVTRQLGLGGEIMEDLVKETLADTGLSAVSQYYKEGWPNDRRHVAEAAKPYWNTRDDIFLEDNLVIFNDRVIVPPSLRKKMLTRLHSAHLGIDKTRARARQSVYWPGVNNDIGTTVSGCRTCERHSASNKAEPLIPHTLPHLPYQKVSADIMTLNLKNYLVMVDNLSQWLEIKVLTSKTNRAHLSRPMAYIPEEIFGDNNLLNSHECREFAKELGCRIVTSSPEYPRSNGLAEKGVHIVKQLIKKAIDSGTHYLDALRDYNNTPLSGTNLSPAQILMSRQCRTTLPTLKRKLAPQVVDARSTLIKKQAIMKTMRDKHAHRRPVSFGEGDRVGKEVAEESRSGENAQLTEATLSKNMEAISSGEIQCTRSTQKPNQTTLTIDRN
ncbi:hypothetical protein FOCC_FOCC014576 [Frankliniella occidentalis]|nr:hypothetical protein FOCC_FOCC014576 [Frankliniella occidentalis]